MQGMCVGYGNSRECFLQGYKCQVAKEINARLETQRIHKWHAKWEQAEVDIRLKSESGKDAMQLQLNTKNLGAPWNNSNKKIEKKLWGFDAKSWLTKLGLQSHRKNAAWAPNYNQGYN